MILVSVIIAITIATTSTGLIRQQPSKSDNCFVLRQQGNDKFSTASPNIKYANFLPEELRFKYGRNITRNCRYQTI